MGQRLGQRFQFGRHAGAGARNLGVLAHTIGGGFSPVRGAESIHDPDVAQRRHFLRQLVVGFLFALVATAVFQDDDFTGFDLESAVDPVLHQPDVLTEQFGHALGNRRERIFRLEFALGRTAKVRGDHDCGALGKCITDTRQRCPDAGVVGDGQIVVLGNVKVGADEDPLAGDVEIGETFESHGNTLFGN